MKVDLRIAKIVNAEQVEGSTKLLRLTLDVDNLFDKTYYTSSYSRLWVTPGTARTVTVGLQAKF